MMEYSRNSKKAIRELGGPNADVNCVLSIKFAIRGLNLCKAGFLTATQLSGRTLYQNSADVTEHFK
eukprot:IDg11543t1